MNELTVEDLDVLIEAIDDWKGKPSMDLFNKDIVSIMLGGPKEEGESISRKYKDASNQRDERATLLKAKVISIRNNMINNVAKSLINQSKEIN